MRMMNMLAQRQGRFDVVVWILLMLVILATTVANASVSRHDVGGTKAEGWRPGRNYTEWSMNEQFYVGDWLYFGYKKESYSVFQVNETSYNSCNTDNPIENITRGAGRDVFELKEPTTYYFISGGGYCWSNLKVAIIVNNPPPPPAEAPLPNDSSSLKVFTVDSLVKIGLSFLLTSFSFLSCVQL